ncbi:Hypothetical predicted protein [Paramuricea clavata]|uniref:Uncharacterized protein n=1 Tax=Paramuricea clavata TaxID=317549 RepID=A0A6S7HAQ7_PARCT|nr:Hypothetical predicted protein [Paramuricea clavata]
MLNTSIHSKTRPHSKTKPYFPTSNAMFTTSGTCSSVTLETYKSTANKETITSSKVYKTSSGIEPTETFPKSSSVTTTNYITPRSPQARDQKNVVTRWWFWMVVVALVLFVMVVVMVILKYKKRGSKIVITKSTSTYDAGIVVENHADGNDVLNLTIIRQ